MQSVVDTGTGTAARQPFPVYGKTGTTDDFTNAWFTGCTRTLCITVWMGYNTQYLHHGKTPHSMVNIEGVQGGVFGGTLPAEIFARTWSNYASLRAAHGTPLSSPSPSSQPQSFAPSSRATSARPTPTRSPAPSPSATPSEAPSASPSQRPTLLPSPGPQRRRR
jgi:membrane peptidoglycan carboxypeptidase